MDRNFVVITSLALTVVIPLLVIYWVANGRSKSKAHLLVKTLAAGVVIAALYVGNMWDFTSHYLRYLFPILFIAATAHAWWKGRGMEWWRRPPQIRDWASLAAGVVVFAGFGLLLPQVMTAGRIPEGAVVLDFPFAAGTFNPAQAGSRRMMNEHVRTMHEQLYRGQSWALDIYQLDRVGRRARGIYPPELARYHIFGTPVVAPCSGTIARRANDFPDHPPPERESDVENAPGNFVLIQCDEGFFVVLAHFAQGSVRVEEGERIRSGDVLGAIGNSGRTTEPHLHIHAQAGPGEEFLSDADPLPIIFRGHGFLKRNDVVRVRR